MTSFFAQHEFLTDKPFITAFAAGVKKSGYNLDRNAQEKITDGARSAYEKATG